MSRPVTIAVERLEDPRHGGDWHDKPLVWRTVGPGDELNYFRTKREATTFATCRRVTRSRVEAGALWLKRYP